MSEKILTPRRVLSSVALALIITSGCGGDTEPGGDPPRTTDVVQEAVKRFECFARANGLEDCDEDGVSNLADVVPGRDDNADDDGDLVANKWDRWPGLNDIGIDSDRDGIDDYQDPFFGNNLADDDGDNWINGIDPQPGAAPPASQPTVQPPQGMTEAELVNALLEQQMRRKYTIELYGPKPDIDVDGIPDDKDTSPNEFTNNIDGDQNPDFYDPEPRDPYIHTGNDPYDPRNYEYGQDDTNYWD